MHLNRRQSWMWTEACALLDEAERKHRRFFELLAAPAQQPAWEPPIDVLADGPEIEILMALPGAHIDEVHLRFTSSGLDVETAVAPRAPSRLGIVRLEIPYGRMYRRIELPSGRYQLLERRLERGLLHIRMRRESV